MLVQNGLLGTQTAQQEVLGSQFDGCLGPIQSPVSL